MNGRALPPSLTIEEVDDAAPLAGELFRRAFAHAIPDFPRHFVARGRDAAGSSAVVGYIHYTAWDGPSWLCGGLCVDDGAYARASPVDAESWKRAGGIGEIILRDTFARLADGVAIFGYCGDARQWQHDLNVGFVPLGHPRLLAHWNRPVPAAEQARLVERLRALGPF